ncbi:MAG: bifunctional phosphoribosyl-AMP cyclohydrolase/phosphoribosyl-ATP diphosphatase HisIE [Lachnospiraceae bacterium]|nr:bifunctional phosphoribosyl-AMP cyclohydrolase/phosphoribosyl-ATP diphosphatase HisIE [Lachnospiraceae bacterium]
MNFSDFKTNSDGLIPVVVQDYKNDEVLMVAYMDENAYIETVKTGKMTYYSRSRKSKWVKGETSGHFQYVKSLAIDCDNDTILARVKQIGAACHTGNRSCFYRNLLEMGDSSKNIGDVLSDVYKTIKDRKINPKEGSYTNYLFDKGIDKILKKCGEEATEIVIAAKNPDNTEIVYELADFLYHSMVLMVEKGIDLEDIANELANRE